MQGCNLRSELNPTNGLKHNLIEDSGHFSYILRSDKNIEHFDLNFGFSASIANSEVARSESRPKHREMICVIPQTEQKVLPGGFWL